MTIINQEIRDAHYEKFLGPLDQPVMHSSDSKPVHIDIYQFAPTDDRPYWTLVTGGMSDCRQPIPSDAPPHVVPRAEILMYVSKPEAWMFSVMKGLAEMPFENDTYLYWHHTVPNGMPMTARPSQLTSFFFLPAYFEEEGFDTLKIEGDEVRFLTLVPITEAERAFAVENGSEALEEMMAAKELDPVVDEDRTSLV